MLVYAVTERLEDDKSNTVAVFSTKEKALEVTKEYKKVYPYIIFDIEEFWLDEW